MAISWYTSAGQPSDTVGAVGDLNFDTTNRIVWVKQANNSWAGGAYSNIGPTGPAQLSGVGLPNANYGQIGNGYCDLSTGFTYLKSSSGWAQVGNITGATGQTGASNLGTTGSAFGPLLQSNNLSLTSTPQAMPFVQGGAAGVYSPIFGSSFMGAIAQTTNTGTTTFALYNQTTGSTIYSFTCGANTSALTGSALFNVGQYPLLTNNSYVWNISNTTSQTGGGILLPIYTTPSASPSQNVAMFPVLGYATSTAIGTTQQNLPALGGTQTFNYYPIRTAGCYAVVATLTATGSTATTATAKLSGYYSRSGSSTNLSWSPATLTANGTPTIVYGPSTDTTTFTSGYSFYFGITATAAMTATLQVQVYAYI